MRVYGSPVVPAKCERELHFANAVDRALVPGRSLPDNTLRRSLRLIAGGLHLHSVFHQGGKVNMACKSDGECAITKIMSPPGRVPPADAGTCVRVQQWPDGATAGW